jgi:hypothetical protein
MPFFIDVKNTYCILPIKKTGTPFGAPVVIKLLNDFVHHTNYIKRTGNIFVPV